VIALPRGPVVLGIEACELSAADRRRLAIHSRAARSCLPAISSRRRK
jgi:hypothetical protein